MSHVHELKSTAHIEETTSKLRQVLELAEAGKLSAIVVFADYKETDDYGIFSSWTDGRLRLVGKLTQILHDLCAGGK